MAPVTRLEVTKIRLLELVKQVQRGRVRMPPIHRPFRWEAEDVKGLFDSVLRGYPIGALLVWEHPVEAEVVHIGGLRVEAQADPHGWSLLDGHQRLSAIVGALTKHEDAADPRLDVCYDVAEDQVVVQAGDDPASTHLLPLSVAADNRRLLQWEGERSFFSQQELDRCDTIAGQLARYEIPLDVVHGGEIGAVAEIFVRLNKGSLSLTDAELNHARTVARSPEGGAATVAEHDVGRSLGFGSLPAQLLAHCRELRSRSGNHHLAVWENGSGFRPRTLEDDLAASISFLKGSAGVPHFRLLPHPSVLPVLAWYISRFGFPKGRESELLCRWVWRIFTLPTFDYRDVFVYADAAGVVSDPIFSIVKLLDTLPRRSAGYQWQPRVEEAGLDRPLGRLNALAMLCLGPTLLVPWAAAGDQIKPAGSRINSRSVIGTLLDEGASVLQPIVFENEGDDLSASLANRIIHPHFETGSPRSALLKGDFTSETLRGHGLTSGLLDRLRSRDVSGFLGLRRLLLTTSLAHQVQRRALWGFDNFGGPTTLIPPGAGDEPDLDS